uniref:collagen alpha-1(I) chain-like n=1 Tax=Euleptes europaea TaxID=460621 RepID=UPI002541CEDD|nr:collagen alpha-1(I) chain-like [Euleptes europaea]
MGIASPAGFARRLRLGTLLPCNAGGPRSRIRSEPLTGALKWCETFPDPEPKPEERGARNPARPGRPRAPASPGRREPRPPTSSPGSGRLSPASAEASLLKSAIIRISGRPKKGLCIGGRTARPSSGRRPFLSRDRRSGLLGPARALVDTRRAFPGLGLAPPDGGPPSPRGCPVLRRTKGGREGAGFGAPYPARGGRPGKAASGRPSPAEPVAHAGPRGHAGDAANFPAGKALGVLGAAPLHAASTDLPRASGAPGAAAGLCGFQRRAREARPRPPSRTKAGERRRLSPDGWKPPRGPGCPRGPRPGRPLCPRKALRRGSSANRAGGRAGGQAAAAPQPRQAGRSPLSAEPAGWTLPVRVGRIPASSAGAFHGAARPPAPPRLPAGDEGGSCSPLPGWARLARSPGRGRLRSAPRRSRSSPPAAVSGRPCDSAPPTALAAGRREPQPARRARARAAYARGGGGSGSEGTGAAGGRRGAPRSPMAGPCPTERTRHPGTAGEETEGGEGGEPGLEVGRGVEGCDPALERMALDQATAATRPRESPGAHPGGRLFLRPPLPRKPAASPPPPRRPRRVSWAAAKSAFGTAPLAAPKVPAFGQEEEGGNRLCARSCAPALESQVRRLASPGPLTDSRGSKLGGARPVPGEGREPRGPDPPGRSPAPAPPPRWRKRRSRRMGRKGLQHACLKGPPAAGRLEPRDGCGTEVKEPSDPFGPRQDSLALHSGGSQRVCGKGWAETGDTDVPPGKSESLADVVSERRPPGSGPMFPPMAEYSTSLAQQLFAQIVCLGAQRKLLELQFPELNLCLLVWVARLQPRQRVTLCKHKQLLPEYENGAEGDPAARSRPVAAAAQRDPAAGRGQVCAPPRPRGQDVASRTAEGERVGAAPARPVAAPAPAASGLRRNVRAPRQPGGRDFGAGCEGGGCAAAAAAAAAGAAAGAAAAAGGVGGPHGVSGERRGERRERRGGRAMPLRAR